MKTSELKRRLTAKRRRAIISADDLLSTGSTLLNLACSGSAMGGIPKGKYILLVGDSASGKTALSLTMLAEATINPEFDDYRLIHDDIEGGSMFDIRRLFGRKLAHRIEPPTRDNEGNPQPSSLIEELYYNIDDAIGKEQPFIYIVDSMDGLDSQDDAEKFQERKQAYRKGKTVAGSYAMSKAKLNSANLRRLMTPLRDSKSILVIVSQTRDYIGFGFETKTRSGGKALQFYAALEIWSSIKQKIKKNIKGKNHTIGIVAKLQVKKNRLSGKDRVVEVPIYYNTGFDDIGSCVDYLIDNQHWKRSGSKVSASELDFTGTRDKLIRHIEEGNYHKRLQRIVGRVWNEIEEACEVKRKSRYD